MLGLLLILAFCLLIGLTVLAETVFYSEEQQS